jgi:ABC-type multidrug transport system ATPase subunit
VSLELRAGVAGLTGHNGAGKTRLMKMIATLTRPTSGQILFQGEDIAARPDAIGAAPITCAALAGGYVWNRRG